MTNFTPVSASIGGALIGLSAVMLMAFSGRIAGISGIFSGVAFAEAGDRLWRLTFVAGLIAAPILYMQVSGETAAFDARSGTMRTIAAGLLVGFGTRLGSGCTSGHGVCGLSRLSPRSMVAVAAFIAAGMVTVAVANAFFGA